MLKNGTNWEDCVLISEQHKSDIVDEKYVRYLQAYYNTLLQHYGSELGRNEYVDNNIWLDTKSDKVFCKGQYQLPRSFGKDHHFYIQKDNFDRSTKKYFYNRLIPQNANLNRLTYTQIGDDLIYGRGNAVDPNRYKGKSIKIIGGGPTTGEVKWENIKTDHIWTCNQFYNNERVAKQKLDLISISSDTPKRGYDHIKEHCYNTNTKACFLLDWGDFNTNSPNYLYDLANDLPDNIFYYHTRYASAIGVGVRMIISAILWGAKDIYFVGIDGIVGTNDKDFKTTHSFEKSKNVPSWYARYGHDFQRRHMVIFWEYVVKLREIYNFNLHNLGESSENNLYRTMSRLLFPLDNKVKEKIKSKI
tara:strand:+ start:95 stop:1174 length:1080 start_codon:yes stop_codon:yes gene_type:complete